MIEFSFIEGEEVFQCVQWSVLPRQGEIIHVDYCDCEYQLYKVIEVRYLIERKEEENTIETDNTPPYIEVMIEKCPKEEKNLPKNSHIGLSQS